ncbi:Serine/threonine protein kinase (fragment) [Hyella patelloides LEGE 07179]|uniref:non-specific serine/threonine protein kinase n=1 Tax=Hyella patelloides LEGE 07179 TaxID=945734 RepID=A0A563VQC1_9CYAN
MATAYQPGDIIKNKYRITHVLGKGGVAITYQASDINTGLSVAIKVISLKQLENWKQVELFQREAEVLAKLEHLAIPKYIDYFDLETETDKAFYIVQQLAPGKSLFDLVESGWRTTETEVKKIAEQVLAILSYLHSLEPPVIHRDIKPNNLIRSDDGTIYLVDFGAVQNTYYNTLMQGSTVVGTYGYMAPEQFRGKAVPATDLYSLGATILYLLTHRSPSELPQDTLKLDFRSSVNISESFADWLEKILEPDLEDRFVDAEVALAELLASNKVKKQKLFTGISVGLLCLALAWGATSYKWFFLSRLGFFPDNLCSSEILESFLSQGGEIERLNFQIKNDGKILLCTLQNSLNNKNISLSQKIINKGANLNMLHNQGIDYLWNAINNKDIVFAKFLIENNINLNYPYPTNEKSILCSKNINIDLLQLMIDI